MHKVSEMIKFPDGTPIEATQVRITKVYPRKEIQTSYGPKTIQDGMIEDSTGKMKFKAWSHPDLANLEGKELIIHAGNKGKGLKVVHNSYTGKNGPTTDILLEVGKDGLFQHVAVYNQSKGVSSDPAPKQAPSHTPSQNVGYSAGQTAKQGGYVHGATAGAAANKAVDILIQSGQAAELANKGELESAIVKIGSQFVRAAQRLEAGDFGEPKQVPTKEQVAPSVDPNTGEADEVPF